MGTRIAQLPVNVPLNANDLLHLQQTDNIDHQLALSALAAWLETQISVGLNFGPFYVDSASGSDAADGLSVATAKQTIAAACAAVPTGAQATINLLNATTPYVLNANIALTKTFIRFVGPSPASMAQIKSAGYVSGGVNMGYGFQLGGSLLSFANCSLEAAPFTNTSDPAGAASFILPAANSSGTLFLENCTIVLNDLPFAQLAAGTQMLNFICSSLSLSSAAANVSAPLAIALNNKLLSLSLTSATLPSGRTAKSLFSGLVYGGDLGPRNVLHNLGNALDSNQS